METPGIPPTIVQTVKDHVDRRGLVTLGSRRAQQMDLADELIIEHAHLAVEDQL
jgi:hypothetical protein